MRCLFFVGDAKIILAPPNGIEKLVSFGQVTKMRWWEVQGQAGGSSSDSFPTLGAAASVNALTRGSQPSQRRNSSQLSRPDGDT